MILYHGSTMEIRNPQIVRGDVGRDFGFAFYTTDIRSQAERWACRRAKVLSRMGSSSVKAVVNVYEWNRTAGLKMKRFYGASSEWLDMVVKCRRDSQYNHGYDVVEGKIANDNVGETVSYVVKGIMRSEDAIKRLMFEKINNQIAFCSMRAIEDLTFVKSYTVEVE